MAGGDKEMPGADRPQGGGGSVQALRKSSTGRTMCSVPDCPRMSDGSRSNFMCRGHYTKMAAEQRAVKEAVRRKEKEDEDEHEHEDEDEEEEEQKTPDEAPGSDDHNGDDEGKGDEEDADVSKPASSPASAAASGAAVENKDNNEEDAGGRRRTRRNRKPSAKVAAAVRDKAELQEVFAKRREQRGGGGGSHYPGGRIDYASLHHGADDQKTKIGQYSRSVHLSAPRRPLNDSPEPSYLFRQGPLPPPSPPVEPRSGPPDFLLPLAGRAVAQGEGGGVDQQEPNIGSSGGSTRPVRRHPHAAHGNIPIEVAGVYAPLIRLRVQRDTDASTILPLPRRTVGGLRDQIEKAKQCNCKKSNCLKLYCECFASAIHCSSLCKCAKCQNNDHSTENVRERSRVVFGMLERNPNAFRPRPLVLAGAAAAATVAAGAGTSDASKKMKAPVSTKACNCRKSLCLKKYCECFLAAVYCNPSSCKCQNCQNFPGNEQREKLMKNRQRQAENAAQTAASQYSHRRISGLRAMGKGRAGEVGDVGDFGEAAVAGGMVEGDGAAAAALAAGAAAAGVDVFLPPSSYAVPMKIGPNLEVPGISFGTSGIKKKHASDERKRAVLASAAKRRKNGPVYTGREKLVETEEECVARLATESLSVKLGMVQALVNKEKEDQQTKKFGGGVQGLSAASYQREQDKNMIPTIISTQMPLSRSNCESLCESKAKERDAKETVRFVKGGLRRIKAASDLAKERAEKFLDEAGKKQPVKQSTSSDRDMAMEEACDPNLEALLCTESMSRSRPGEESVQGRELSDAERELFLLTSQDAALMHELAKVIRGKALEMGAERIKRAAEAAGKARSAAEAIVEAGN